MSIDFRKVCITTISNNTNIVCMEIEHIDTGIKVIGSGELIRTKLQLIEQLENLIHENARLESDDKEARTKKSKL